MNRTWIALFIVVLLSLNSYGGDKPLAGVLPHGPVPVVAGAVVGSTERKSTRELNFDDSLLEGMNARPLDSLENIEIDDKKKKSQLYWKRQSFKQELMTGAKEMEFQP